MPYMSDSGGKDNPNAYLTYNMYHYGEKDK